MFCVDILSFFAIGTFICNAKKLGPSFFLVICYLVAFAISANVMVLEQMHVVFESVDVNRWSIFSTFKFEKGRVIKTGNDSHVWLIFLSGLLFLGSWLSTLSHFV